MDHSCPVQQAVDNANCGELNITPAKKEAVSKSKVKATPRTRVATDPRPRAERRVSLTTRPLRLLQEYHVPQAIGRDDFKHVEDRNQGGNQLGSSKPARSIESLTSKPAKEADDCI